VRKEAGAGNEPRPDSASYTGSSGSAPLKLLMCLPSCSFGRQTPQATFTPQLCTHIGQASGIINSRQHPVGQSFLHASGSACYPPRCQSCSSMQAPRS
jgi:hypothetical protein